jgi:iron-sulfur cluster repair protein YtfE (RIC family)
MHRIGSTRASKGDLVDALLECHGRIRQMTAIARALVAAGPDRIDREVSEAAGRVRRYFVEALPRHVADEEESIRPRLRGREQVVDAAMAEMSADHHNHEAPVARLIELCSRLEVAPEALEAARGELDEVVRALESDFAVHLEREEQVIFPAIRRLLSSEEQAAIHGEMRARRAM